MRFWKKEHPFGKTSSRWRFPKLHDVWQVWRVGGLSVCHWVRHRQQKLSFNQIGVNQTRINQQTLVTLCGRRRQLTNKLLCR